ncbi:hypothetical protein B0H14DRAFT_2600438 [Mycena olivaceomarginata]|nr:hypothetical protein B0H14DRAFT_2600438 [Mycena olivaceomarginata]
METWFKPNGMKLPKLVLITCLERVAVLSGCVEFRSMRKPDFDSSRHLSVPVWTGVAWNGDLTCFGSALVILFIRTNFFPENANPRDKQNKHSALRASGRNERDEKTSTAWNETPLWLFFAPWILDSNSYLTAVACHFWEIFLIRKLPLQITEVEPCDGRFQLESSRADVPRTPVAMAASRKAERDIRFDDRVGARVVPEALNPFSTTTVTGQLSLSLTTGFPEWDVMPSPSPRPPPCRARRQRPAASLLHTNRRDCTGRTAAPSRTLYTIQPRKRRGPASATLGYSAADRVAAPRRLSRCTPPLRSPASIKRRAQHPPQPPAPLAVQVMPTPSSHRYPRSAVRLSRLLDLFRSHTTRLCDYDAVGSPLRDYGDVQVAAQSHLQHLIYHPQVVKYQISQGFNYAHNPRTQDSLFASVDTAVSLLQSLIGVVLHGVAVKDGVAVRCGYVESRPLARDDSDDLVTLCFSEGDCFQASAVPAGPFATASLSAPGVECTLSPEPECVGNTGLNGILSNSARTVAPSTLGLPTVGSFLCTPDADIINLCFPDVAANRCIQASTVTNDCANMRRFSEAFESIQLECNASCLRTRIARVPRRLSLGAVGLRSNVGRSLVSVLKDGAPRMPKMDGDVSMQMDREQMKRRSTGSNRPPELDTVAKETRPRTAAAIHRKPGDPKCQEIGRQDIRIVCESATRGAIEMLHGREKLSKNWSDRPDAAQCSTHRGKVRHTKFETPRRQM